MGIIHLEDMEFYAFHGHYEEERIVGNKFLVNLFLKTDMSKAANSDSIKHALNYQEVYQVVKEEMKEKSHLLEHIAKRILDVLYKKFDQIEECTIKISKMNPSMGGKMRCVSVEMSR